MTDFLDLEAVVKDDCEIDENVSDATSDDSLVDDECEGNDLSFYRSVDQQLENVGDIDEILREELEQQYKEAETLEPNNLLHQDELLDNIVKIGSDSTQYLNIFKKTFFPIESRGLTFKNALQYAVRYFKFNLKDTCNEFENSIVNQLDDDLKIELDLDKFENTCYHINEILNQEDLFLRVYEIKNDYREIRLKKTENTKIEKQLFSCLKIKFNGFEILIKERTKKV